MALQIPVGCEAVAGEDMGDDLIRLSLTLAYMRTAISNVVFLGLPGHWFLVDTGVPGSRAAIERAVATHFEGPPWGILLTHGHFDHVGAVVELATKWGVRVFAHPAEHPFLDGSRSYPPAHPRASDGLMSLLSPLYPRRPVDLGRHLRSLTGDGNIPGADGWRWIATPGHSPGHVSFWHPETRHLIAGDAFITTGQESAYEVARQAPEVHGPPRYFTGNWFEAETSVKKLAHLDPEVAVTGHGPALQGPELRDGLRTLAARFWEVGGP
jgi:glyoxylase-like metal-dependent hydrolase (beta-lactamase superfamily II)